MKAIVIFFITALLFNFDAVSQWIQTASTPQGAGITDMLVTPNGTIVVTCASYNWPNGQQGGIRRSTNGGASWQNIVNVYNGRTLHLGSTGKIFASYWPYPSNEGMYYSTNGGLNWTQSYFGNSNDNVFSIISKDNDNTVFIGTRYGVWRQINNGLWQFVSTGIPANTYVYDLDIDSTGVYIAAGTSKGIYVSSNNGSSWNPVSGTANDTFYTVKFAHFPERDGLDESVMYGGAASGRTFKSDANTEYLKAVLIIAFFGKLGDTEVITDGALALIALGISPHNFDNMIGAGFSYSTDRGQTWQEFNGGLPANPKSSCLAYSVSGGNINWLLGTFENTNGGAKIYKMSSPIGIQQVSSELPEKFSLSQNYPNPFNPMTKIKFSLTKASKVNITVFDILGRHVTTLVEQQLGAGTYETEWDAVNIPAGTYFYKIEADGFTETKKMILVK